MNGPPADGTTASRTTSARRGWPVLLVSVLLLLLGVGLFLMLRPSPRTDFAWLTPEQFTQVSKPGPWPRLQKAINSGLAYFSHRPRIWCELHSWCWTAEMARRIPPLSPAISTNAAGGRVWVLSPMELDVLERQFRTMSISGASVLLDISSSGRLPLMSASKAAAAIYPKLQKWDGSALYRSGSIKVIFSVRNSPGQVQTGLSLAFRASIPEAGGLLIEHTEPGDPSGAKFLLIFTARVVDSQGNPISRSARTNAP